MKKISLVEMLEQVEQKRVGSLIELQQKGNADVYIADLWEIVESCILAGLAFRIKPITDQIVNIEV